MRDLSRPFVLIAPSVAAALELPRRLASTGRALVLYRFPEPGPDSGVLGLARALAEPLLLGRGLRDWDYGHDARLAAKLLAEDPEGGFPLPPDVPRGPVAAALARTLAELRQAGVPPERLEALAGRADVAVGDAPRLRTLARLFRAFAAEREGRVADPTTILAAAHEALGRTDWLQEAEILIVDDLELDEGEQEFLSALARAFPVRLLRREMPPGLLASSFRAWAGKAGILESAWEDTPLAPLAPAPLPPGLARLRAGLFEPPSGPPADDDSVELVTGPGEAAEARAITRRLLREAARGVPFEEMGVLLPRPDPYAPLFTDLLARLGIPHQLHPSLPLRFGRCARSLLLLFRCRGLPRAAVMELLTFAPIPFETMLGEAVRAWPSRWDQISRDAQIVSGLERWIIGLRSFAELEQEAAGRDANPDRAERRLRTVADAEALLRVVELLALELDALSGEATWREWSERLKGVCERWVAPQGETDREREAVLRVLTELSGLSTIDARVAWNEVQMVVEARFEHKRLPLDPPMSGAVHVGALDALAGLPFRVVAIPGLGEGGYPGVLRPDPFLLDPEREALAEVGLSPPAGRAPRKKPEAKAQLSLFAEPGGARPGGALATTQDRLLEARRLFQRAVAQARERLILSYPRADPRNGRERLPSLFFVAAASARAGRPLAGNELERLVEEDVPESLDAALDPGERDRLRVREGGQPAAEAIATGSIFFRQSRWAVRGRWSNRLTVYDGLLADLPEEARRRLDPLSAPGPISASRLATFSRCGFLYLLQHVLRLEPALEPEERKRLEPLERGDLFHRVAERFLRECRERGELPLRDVEATRARLLEMAEEALTAHVAGSPPRFTVLWEREKARFRQTLLGWLAREAAGSARAMPAHFEVSFGMGQSPSGGEPHAPLPLTFDLGDGRMLRMSGKIDRIDRRPDGTLVLRDYKTGKAPKDELGIFKGGKQLQVPFYILAAAQLFPNAPVVEAFLDYVDGGRQVAVDPEVVRSDGFRALLGGLVEAIGQGLFVQEPSACPWCEYTAVCGPRPLLERRRQIKGSDPQLIRILRLRDMG
jgi:ATP-dependent helicase/nuclease subunit B